MLIGDGCRGVGSFAGPVALLRLGSEVRRVLWLSSGTGGTPVPVGTIHFAPEDRRCCRPSQNQNNQIAVKFAQDLEQLQRN